MSRMFQDTFMPEGLLVGTGTLARVTGLDRKTIIAMSDKGVLPHLRLPSGTRKYRLPLVLEALEAMAVYPEGNPAPA